MAVKNDMCGECLKPGLGAASRIEARVLHSAHHFAWRDTECSRQANNGPKRRALHTTFNCAQLGPIDAEFDVSIQLRKSRLLANLSQHNSKGLFRT